MKRNRYSVEQIVAVLKQAVELGLSAAELTRRVGISEQTFYLYGRLSRCKVIS